MLKKTVSIIKNIALLLLISSTLLLASEQRISISNLCLPSSPMLPMTPMLPMIIEGDAHKETENSFKMKELSKKLFISIENNNSISFHEVLASTQLSNIINLQNETDTTALIYAIENYRFEMATALIKNKANLNFKNKNGYTALSRATNYNNKKIVLFLLQNGADPTDDIPYLFSSALTNNDTKTAAFLLQKKNGTGVKNYTFLDQKDYNGDTCLHNICFRKNASFLEVLKIIIQDTSLLNRQNNIGETALHKACYGNAQFVQILLDNHADSNIKDKQDNTILHTACKYNNYKAIAPIFIKNPNLFSTTKADGNTPLHETCCNSKRPDNSTTIEALLKQKVDPNTQNNFGNTVLHLTCINRKSVSHIKSLAQSEIKIDLNLKNIMGETALLIACKRYISTNEHSDLLRIEELLRLGANPTIQDKNQDEVLHLAIKNRNRNLLDILFEYDLWIQDHENITQNLINLIPQPDNRMNQKETDLFKQYLKTKIEESVLKFAIIIKSSKRKRIDQPFEKEKKRCTGKEEAE